MTAEICKMPELKIFFLRPASTLKKIVQGTVVNPSSSVHYFAVESLNSAEING